MGEVRILITDEIDDECVILADYNGNISDSLKDVLSSEIFQESIMTALADKGFFAENVQ